MKRPITRPQPASFRAWTFWAVALVLAVTLSACQPAAGMGTPSTTAPPAPTGSAPTNPGPDTTTTKTQVPSTGGTKALTAEQQRQLELQRLKDAYKKATSGDSAKQAPTSPPTTPKGSTTPNGSTTSGSVFRGQITWGTTAGNLWLKLAFSEATYVEISFFAAVCSRFLTPLVCVPLGVVVSDWARGVVAAGNHGIILTFGGAGQITVRRW